MTDSSGQLTDAPRSFTAQEVRRLEAEVRMLADMSDIVARTTDAAQLYHDSCRSAVETGGFRMAWIGLIDDASHLLWPVAMMGHVDGFLDRFRLVVDDAPASGDRIATALRAKRHFVCRDVEGDAAMERWREAALARDYRALAAFPLTAGGSLVGAYFLHSSEAGAFREEEVKLLDVVASNFSCSLEALQRAHDRAQAEAGLREETRRLHSILDSMAEAVVVANANGELVEFNRAAELLHGVGLSDTPPEGWGQRYGIFLPDGETVCPADGIPLRIAMRGEQCDNVERFVRRPDGTGSPVEVTARPILGADGRITGGVAVFTDVTERKLAADRLRASEERFRLIFDNMMEGCMLIGPDWTYLYVNDSAARHGHEDRTRLVGRRMTEIYPGIEGSEIFARYRRCMESREPQHFESPYTFADGTTSWFEFSVEPAPEGILIRSQEITERRAAEAELRSASRYARELIEVSLDPLVTISPEGRITDVNHATESVTGLGRGRLIGTDFADYFTEPARAREGYQTVLRDGLVRDYPLTIRHSSGRTTDVLYNAAVYRNEQGEMEGVFAAARDVTERKQAEEALRRERDFSAKVLDTAGSLVLVLDLDARIVTFNKACEACTGYSFEEVAGRDFFELFAVPDERQRAAAFWQQLRSTGRPERIRFHLERKGGAKRLIDWTNATLTSVDGSPEFVMSTGTDITDQVALESQLRQSQKMEAIGRLAGGVAHDFNNVITAISGFGELVLADLKPHDPHREDVEEILRAAKRAESLTRRLLAFSRQQVLAPRKINLNEVVRGFEKMVRRFISEEITLHLDLAEPLGTVEADPGQVEQVILNLVVNARDAMPTGGTLTILTRDVEGSAEWAREAESVPAGRYVMLGVRDSGFGMDDEVQSHLFEPFFTTKAKGKGTGLGLATVYGIVRQSHGFVNVQSTPNLGSTFEVYLPQIEQPAESITSAPVQAAGGRGSETVLLVEDEEAVRRIALTTLTRRGYTVLAAANGDEALAVSANHEGSIALLLTDLVMPGMNGLDLLERLRVSRPSTRALVMSGYSDHPLLQSVLARGSAAFLQKPFTPDQLAKTVRSALDQIGAVRA